LARRRFIVRAVALVQTLPAELHQIFDLTRFELDEDDLNALGMSRTTILTAEDLSRLEAREIVRMILEAFATEVSFRELIALDRGAHRPVQHQNSFFEQIRY